MGSDPDSITYLGLASCLKSLLPTKNQSRSQKSEKELRSYCVKILLKSQCFKDHAEELTCVAASPSLMPINRTITTLKVEGDKFRSAGRERSL